MIMHSSFAILLMLLVRTLARHCPNEVVIEPCKCSDGPEGYSPSHVTCEDFDSYDDLQKVFDNSLDYSFDTLDFKNCAIPHLNSTWITNKRVKTLFMGEMTMTDLMDSGIGFTSPSIVHVSIGRTKILRRVRWEHFRPFTGLSTLAITNTEVRALGKDFGSYVSPQLTQLTIAGARLKALKDVSLKGKTKLFLIVFKRNRIKVLKNSFFEDQVHRLSMIDFSYNPIESIPEDLFNRMGYLDTVVLEGTNLKTLPKLLNYGRYNVLYNTPLVCDCRMSWIPDKYSSSRHDSFTLVGSCESPPNLKSKNLSDLTKSDFSACDGK